jgi:hypothetical protein
VSVGVSAGVWVCVRERESNSSNIGEATESNQNVKNSLATPLQQTLG